MLATLRSRLVAGLLALVFAAALAGDACAQAQRKTPTQANGGDDSGPRQTQPVDAEGGGAGGVTPTRPMKNSGTGDNVPAAQATPHVAGTTTSKPTAVLRAVP